MSAGPETAAVSDTGTPAGTGTPAEAGGRRTTRQRRTIEAALAERDDFASAQELHADLRAAAEDGAKIGLATVYRTLSALVEEGRADVLRNPDGEARYRICASEHHHHHLVCRSCGRAIEVEGPAVEAWADALGAAHGFTDIAHTLELFGTCRDCAA